MGQNKFSDAFKLASIRKETFIYCESLPRIIETHGSNSIGSVALALGKYFSWVGPTLDEYSLHQPLPGIAPLPRVADLGEQLRVLGLEIIHNPKDGELARTVETLKRQIGLLETLAKIQAAERGTK
jgi:hypothetical protein